MFDAMPDAALDATMAVAIDMQAARPRRLDELDDVAEIMSHEAMHSLFERIVSLAKGFGEITAVVNSQWRGGLRWANNEVISTEDMVDHRVTIQRRIRGALSPMVTTNRLDDESLLRALDFLQYQLQFASEHPDALPLLGPQRISVPPTLYASSTAELLAGARSKLARDLTAPVASRELRASGYLSVDTMSRGVLNTNALDAYARASYAQYSVTVRNATGTGSGWAGVNFNDWNDVNPAELTARAEAKCVASAEPRGVEPGRYTAILEPQAVHDLMQWVFSGFFRPIAESSPGPYHRKPDYSRIGQQLLDPRISISSDPMDPECTFFPFMGTGEPYRATTWFQDGVLRDLTSPFSYAIANLGLSYSKFFPRSYRTTGGSASVDEMIKSTERGVLVTRLSGMQMIDGHSLLVSGVTRDGLWLIEDGRITHPIKNFRFLESPLFAFNSVEQLGIPTRVFDPPTSVIVPAVKVRDFNFVALADAV